MEKIQQLQRALHDSAAVVIGAGSGLSTAAGLTYSGERFRRYFSDFIRKYGIRDMYSGGFSPLPMPVNTGPGGAGPFTSTATSRHRLMSTAVYMTWCRTRITSS